MTGCSQAEKAAGSLESGSFPCLPHLLLLRHGLEVEVFRPVHTGTGAQDLGLEEGPGKPLKGQAVVAEKAGHGHGGRSQDAQPAGGLLAHDAFEGKIDAYRRANCQDGAQKLPGGQSEKDGLPVLVDFLWNLDLHILPSPRNSDFLTRFLKYEIILIVKTVHFNINKGGFYYVPEFDAGTADVFLLPCPVSDPAGVLYSGEAKAHARIDLPGLREPDLS